MAFWLTLFVITLVKPVIMILRVYHLTENKKGDDDDDDNNNNNNMCDWRRRM